MQDKPPKLTIGTVELEGRVLLAPMSGITDPPFRQICRSFQASLVTSEMVTSDIQQWHTEKSRLRLAWSDADQPKSVQIAGSDPDKFVEAAQRCEQLGAQIIDLNMGCPAKKVCRKWAGSALLQDEQLVEQILRRVVKAVSVPVTLKTRLGWDQAHKNILTIANIAEDSGIKMISIHGRTRCQGYRGEAEYGLIRSVKARLGIPVIANGDITSEKKAKQVLDLTNSDGIMLGRATQGRPWLIRSVQQYIRGAPTEGDPPLAQRMDTVMEHLRLIHDFYGPTRGVKIARKHLLWYAQGFEGSDVYRKNVSLVACAVQQVAHTRAFYERLIDEAVADNGQLMEK